MKLLLFLLESHLLVLLSLHKIKRNVSSCIDCGVCAQVCPSSIKVDKVTTVPRSKLGERIGRLADQDMVRLGRAVVVFFGLAGN